MVAPVLAQLLFEVLSSVEVEFNQCAEQNVRRGVPGGAGLVPVGEVSSISQAAGPDPRSSVNCWKVVAPADARQSTKMISFVGKKLHGRLHLELK